MRILNREELIQLTGKRTRTAQARVLRHLGIDFRVRPDGKIIVIDADLPLRTSTGPRQESFTPFTIRGQEA